VVEQAAVNRPVGGSNPSLGAIFFQDNQIAESRIARRRFTSAGLLLILQTVLLARHRQLQSILEIKINFGGCGGYRAYLCGDESDSSPQGSQ
jgi:hypothetical protein